MKAGQLTCRALGLGAAVDRAFAYAPGLAAGLRLAARHGVALCVSIALLLAPISAPATARPGDEDRTLSFYHIHTQETLTVTYKKNGQFVPEALEKINWIMRDWRENKSIAMDPNTIDIIWEMYQELGSHEPVNIICGYRSRGTNEMLRRTVGGQASQSQHITGKAVDLTFPDVPLRRMRYSAMVRERGGVGFYPTSGIPFVHVDTSRVRHWPRMPRDELALLFPSGHSQHEPADGRPITLADVRSARARSPDLATEVAQYFALRDAPKATIQVAEASPPPAPVLAPPRPSLAQRPPAAEQRMSLAAEQRMAVGAPLPPPTEIQPEAKPTLIALAPKLVSAPRPIDRPSKFVAKLPDSDRSRLDMLVQLASLEDRVPQPVSAAHNESPAESQAAVKTASLNTGSTTTGSTARASMTSDWPFSKSAAVTDTAVAPTAAPDANAEHPLGEGSRDWRSGWMSAPAYDEDHPDELSYRPFALAPLLTDTASFDDPALTTMVHPDVSKTLDMLDDEGTALPLRFGTGHSQTAMASAQAFSGDAVDMAAINTPEPRQSGTQLVERSVKTTLPR